MGTIWCGIDPGLSGALAFMKLEPARPTIEAVMSMPLTVSRNNYGRVMGVVDWTGVYNALDAFKPELTIVERQWPRPREGVTSAFKAGTNFGGLLGTLAAMRLTHHAVTPVAWKTALGLRGRSKEASRELAIELLPEGRALFARKKDHGRAEAALLVLWKAKYETSPLSYTRRNEPGRGHVEALPDPRPDDV